MAAGDWDRGVFAEVAETVTRRIGGESDQTESVTAVVELDNKAASAFAQRGNLIDGERGQLLEGGILIELAADQQTTPHDTWVVRGAVYVQLGDPVGSDGGSKTIVCVKRKGMRGRMPRTTSQRS